MLTKKQVGSLPKGFHSNTELMKMFPDSKHFSNRINKLYSKIFDKNQ